MSIAPQTFQRIATACAFGFLITVVLWQVFSPENRLGMILAGLACIPGLIALPGMLKGKTYTHAWSTMLATLYVAYCAMEAYSSVNGRIPALMCMSLATVWFISSNLFVRGSRVQ